MPNYYYSYKGLPVQLELIAGVGTGLLLLSIIIFIIILIIILIVKHRKRTTHRNSSKGIKCMSPQDR